MSAESAADRAAFLSLSDFGITVSCDAGTFLGILDNEFVDSLDTETTVPAINCQTADVARLELRKGAVLMAAGATYTLRRHQPDGTGMSVLILDIPR